VDFVDPRQARLQKEYQDLVELRNQCDGIFEFYYNKSNSSYYVTINKLKTFIGKNNTSDRHKFILSIPPEFPINQPTIIFEKRIFHPNWYDNGRVCFGHKWNPSITIRELIIDIVKMMMFDLVNVRSPASPEATSWYCLNKNNIQKQVTKFQFPPLDTINSSTDDTIEIIADSEDIVIDDEDIIIIE